MQVNEFNTGWIRKRFIISCTLMAATVPELEAELLTAKVEIQNALDYHQHRCAKIQIVVAAGLKSSRAERPAMRERLENDADLRQFARRCAVSASFLDRMGDAQGKFRIRKG